MNISNTNEVNAFITANKKIDYLVNAAVIFWLNHF
jgi:hypothetical protein